MMSINFTNHPKPYKIGTFSHLAVNCRLEKVQTRTQKIKLWTKLIFNVKSKNVGFIIKSNIFQTFISIRQRDEFKFMATYYNRNSHFNWSVFGTTSNGLFRAKYTKSSKSSCMHLRHYVVQVIMFWFQLHCLNLQFFFKSHFAASVLDCTAIFW